MQLVMVGDEVSQTIPPPQFPALPEKLQSSIVAEELWWQ
jgi:hypothetical protein